MNPAMCHLETMYGMWDTLTSSFSGMSHPHDLENNENIAN